MYQRGQKVVVLRRQVRRDQGLIAKEGVVAWHRGRRVKVRYSAGDSGVVPVEDVFASPGPGHLPRPTWRAACVRSSLSATSTPTNGKVIRRPAPRGRKGGRVRPR